MLRLKGFGHVVAADAVIVYSPFPWYLSLCFFAAICRLSSVNTLVQGGDD